jgi:hypothetical protein
MTPTGIDPIDRLTRDIRNAARLLTQDQVRYLVDAYYAHQEDRIRASHQQRTLAQAEEPHEVVSWVQASEAAIERGIKTALGVYALSHPVGQWSLSITGIGPILASGLLAHIDIEKAPTVGHIWSYAGLAPGVKWEKHSIRPWNARLKLLTWKIGESFVKVSGHPDDFYGKKYLERKAYEIDRNEKGELASEAERALSEKNYRGDTIAKRAYQQGKLPDGHIHARAKRWTVKLFLSHWHYVAYQHHYKTPPPKPYVLDHVGGHTHFVGVPLWPLS